ncbi:MAG: hypothetical protein PVF15_11025 [Candidatus Bathyarchaeota archaeon]|jgi:hypothetical protein
MEPNMFEIKGKFGSAKQKMFNIIRSISGLEPHSNTCSYTPTFAIASQEPAKPFVDLPLEAESKQAEALMHIRTFSKTR